MLSDVLTARRVTKQEDKELRSVTASLHRLNTANIGNLFNLQI
jgi:hypothetical protein